MSTGLTAWKAQQQAASADDDADDVTRRDDRRLENSLMSIDVTVVRRVVNERANCLRRLHDGVSLSRGHSKLRDDDDVSSVVAKSRRSVLLGRREKVRDGF